MGKSKKKSASNREVKDSAFTAYFKEPQNACKLYAALGDEEVSPEDIRSRINTEENTETLRIWHKAAARAQSFDHFREVLKS